MQLSKWKKLGYFTGDSAVMVRKVEGDIAVSDKKRQHGDNKGSRKGIKRVKFDIRVDDTTISDDLINDFEDDDDDDDDKEEAENPRAINSNNWVSSDSIDFGDGGEIEDHTTDAVAAAAAADDDDDDDDNDDNDGDGDEEDSD